jgi:glycine cleavage system aminomethyltransferase T
LAKAGTPLDVEVLGERITAQVAELPLVDPKGLKIRA